MNNQNKKDIEEHLMDFTHLVLIIAAIIFATSFTVFALVQVWYLFFPK